MKINSINMTQFKRPAFGHQFGYVPNPELESIEESLRAIKKNNKVLNEQNTEIIKLLNTLNETVNKGVDTFEKKFVNLEKQNVETAEQISDIHSQTVPSIH